MAEEGMIKYYKQEVRITLHHFYIVDEIGPVDEFLDLIQTLKTAEEHDTIFIYLNTPGGDLYTAIQIIAAMRQSQATVVTCLEGEVASAGTLIFLAAHKYVVNANCTFMIHNYSTWHGGKGNEVAARVKHSEKFFHKLAADLYGKFLTEEEIQEMVNGKDFWMDSEEVLARLTPGGQAGSTVDEIMQDDIVPETVVIEEPEVEEEPEAAPAPKKPRKKAAKKTAKKSTKKK